MSGLPQELRYVLQGFLVTVAMVGAIASLSGSLYLGLTLLISSKASLLQALAIPGLSSWLLLGALVQLPLWMGLVHLRFLPKRFGRLVIGLLVAIALFALVGGLMLSNSR
jgi:hypothetical protein